MKKRGEQQDRHQCQLCDLDRAEREIKHRQLRIGDHKVPADNDNGGGQATEGNQRCQCRIAHALDNRDGDATRPEPEQRDADNQVRKVVVDLEREDPRVGDFQKNDGHRNGEDTAI
jgi:hypothetical protein